MDIPSLRRNASHSHRIRGKRHSNKKGSWVITRAWGWIDGGSMGLVTSSGFPLGMKLRESPLCLLLLLRFKFFIVPFNLFTHMLVLRQKSYSIVVRWMCCWKEVWAILWNKARGSGWGCLQSNKPKKPFSDGVSRDRASTMSVIYVETGFPGTASHIEGRWQMEAFNFIVAEQRKNHAVWLISREETHWSIKRVT